MWIEKLNNGKYKCTERYTDYITGKSKKVSVTIEKNTRITRKAAEESLARKISEKQSITPNADLTLKQLIELYHAHQSRTTKASTLRRNYYSCKSVAELLGYDIIVNNLNAGYVRAKMIKTGRSNSTLNDWLKRFKALLRWGYQNDYVDDIRYLDKLLPFEDVSSREKIQDKYLEKEELEILLDHMQIEAWRLLTKFLSLSGLRIGEAIALELKDIDFENEVIHVTKTYDSNNQLITSTKTLTSTRDVYIQPELKELCREIKSYMMRQMLRHGYKSKLFFSRTDGAIIQYCAYNKYLKENGVAALGRNKITPHVLRHTHVCLLAEQSIPFDTISRRLGHCDSRITKEVYFHITERIKEVDKEHLSTLKLLKR